MCEPFPTIAAPGGVFACGEAGGEGFEPSPTVPETAVLPLDDPPGFATGEILPQIENFAKRPEGSHGVMGGTVDEMEEASCGCRAVCSP